jgi:hypothetical protein
MILARIVWPTKPQARYRSMMISRLAMMHRQRILGAGASWLSLSMKAKIKRAATRSERAHGFVGGRVSILIR